MSELDAALLTISIDGFERYRRLTGKGAAASLADTVFRLVNRATWRASDGVARTSESEFAILLMQTSPLGARAVADRLRLTVQNELLGRVTVSIGIAFTQNLFGADLFQLSNEARERAAKAQELGGNRILFSLAAKPA